MTADSFDAGAGRTYSVVTAATPGQADIPLAELEAAAAAIMIVQNANDDEPERFEAMTLARAALGAARAIAAQDARPAPDLSAGLADLESELRDVTRQVALCRSTKIPCVFCEQEITRAMGAVQRWAQDVAEHERTREPEPAPELAAYARENRILREQIAEIIATFGPTGSGHTARVGQVQIRKWRERAGLPS